ncbi:MAG TPA: DHA2 family efflux MFS transporter permease subunit, partial [Bryobacteraceae bacterium]|nr:DHA2 family efflux MFS transporter permease subunit [Bryobacteraceae bacterium]
LTCIIIFTISSFACGAATNLGMILIARAIQGAGGGALQPLSQAILLESFPPQKRGVAMAVFAQGVVVAPILGPVIGGWITDSYSWRWIFYINLPVGILTLFLVLRLVEDPPYLARMKGAGMKIDYIGIALLTLGIGALQILLDKGQEEDWFGSHFIVTLAVVASVCLTTLVFWEWRQKAPVIDVHMFRSFNFAVASLMMFTLGLLLFAGLVMMPQFLQTLMGYTAQSAGLVLSGAGMVILFEMPIVGQLTTKIPAKYIMAFGWLSLAWGMYYSTIRMDLDISFQSAAWLRVAQAFGLGFLFVPINLAAFIGVPPEKGSSVSGLINFMRNIGSSVGTSVVTTLLARRAQFHQSILGYHATNYDPAFRNQVRGLSQQLVHAGATAPDANVQAYGRMYRSVLAQSTTLAYIDTYMVLAVASAVMFVLAFIVRRNDPGGGGHVVME